MKTHYLIISFFFVALLGVKTSNAQGIFAYAVKGASTVNNSDEAIQNETADVAPYSLKVDPLVNTKFVITRLTDEKFKSGINLFPNPVKDILHLNLQRVKDVDITTLSYSLQTMDGEEVASNKVSNVVENIDMAEIEKDNYKLMVSSADVVIKSYQIKVH